MNGKILKKLREVSLFLENLCCTEEQYLVIAVSGGPDSMGLLAFMEEFVQNYKHLHLVLAHVNHNTGRVGQQEEQEFLKEYCFSKGIIFETITLEKIEEDNFHRKAHELRYHFFERILQKYHSKYLFTAHHADDLIETILMRLVRGSTGIGYHGFSRVTEMHSYFLVRPFIHLSKQEILDYVNFYQVPYFIDCSNDSNIYTRNRFRKYVVPALRKESSCLEEKFYIFSEQMEEYYHYVQDEALEVLKNIYKDKRLDITAFSSYPVILQKHLIREVLLDVYRDTLYKVDYRHVQLLIEGIQKKGNKEFKLPGLTVQKMENQMIFKEFSGKILKQPLKNKNHFILGDIVVLEQEALDGNDVCRLSCSSVSLPLYIRSRKEGDVVRVKGLSGTKKLSDIFINEKVPKQIRDQYPLVVDSRDEIVWIPNLKKTQFDKTKDEKYDIILKYYEGGKK